MKATANRKYTLRDVMIFIELRWHTLNYKAVGDGFAHGDIQGYLSVYREVFGMTQNQYLKDRTS
jgi:hypothetical protein